MKKLNVKEAQKKNGGCDPQRQANRNLAAAGANMTPQRTGVYTLVIGPFKFWSR